MERALTTCYCWFEQIDRNICLYAQRKKIDKKVSIDRQKQERQIYEPDIFLFEENVGLFHRHGSSSFSTSKLIGGLKTFYCHVLRFYMPAIVHDT